MEHLFSSRAMNTKKSFIREILKVTRNPEVISFAGGLPNPQFFPTEAITQAAVEVLAQDGPNVLQYSTTEGYLPLRAYIANRYMQRYGMQVEPDEILITNGSQQGLDLVGKVFLDRDDRIILERPGYLGAIQAFSMYEPHMLSVPLLDDGIDLNELEQTLKQNRAKLFYTVSNFQNPSGVTYSTPKREALAQLLNQHQVLLVEDDPYGELRFEGQDLSSIKSYAGDGGILLGSFSKIVAPGMRLGWICAPKPIMKKLIIVKQASDLHSNYLAQRILYQYLQDNDLESHLAQIRTAYEQQRSIMISIIAAHFPPEIHYVKPEGGMFLWLTLPNGMSSLALFECATQENVAFVPGSAFYVDDSDGDNSLRLNFSNANSEKITTGMKRLARAIAQINPVYEAVQAWPG